MPVWPSRRSTGTTRRHERRWWMRAPGMRVCCWGSCKAAGWRQGWPRPRGCWPPWWARTWTRTPMAASGSPVRSPPTGCSPPSTPTPATATRAAPAALTATRGTPRSTPTASWSPRPPPPPATSAMRPPRPGCWLSWSTRSKAPRRHRPQLRLPAMARQHTAGIDPRVKIQAAVAPRGHFTKDQFRIDLAAGVVTCPAKRAAPIVYNPNPRHRHHGQASFGPACASCPLRGRCTSAQAGRTVTITAYEHQLAAARARQADPDRAADYRATRPKVERKLAHLVRRRHGGRRVRVRGLAKVAADFNLLAAAVNLARLGVLGLSWTPSDGWVAA